MQGARKIYSYEFFELANTEECHLPYRMPKTLRKKLQKEICPIKDIRTENMKERQ
jgi:hypothetical protein